MPISAPLSVFKIAILVLAVALESARCRKRCSVAKDVEALEQNGQVDLERGSSRFRVRGCQLVYHVRRGRRRDGWWGCDSVRSK